MGIGNRIKEARERLGLTQTELGNMVGVTGSAITNYEKETSHPKEQVIYKLMETLDVDANYLFQDMVKPKTSPNDISSSEYDMIKKYRELDEHGKKMVNFTIENEWERSARENMPGQQSLFDLFPPEEFENMVQTITKTTSQNTSNSKEIDDDFPDNLIKLFDMFKDFTMTNAAHERTDIHIADEDIKHDEDIMDSEDF